jgi:hypothetical protein
MVRAKGKLLRVVSDEIKQWWIDDQHSKTEKKKLKKDLLLIQFVHHDHG